MYWDTQGATPQQHLGTHPVKHLFQFMILTCSSAQASKTTPFLQGTYCIQDNKHMDLLQNPMCQQLPENLVICTQYNPARGTGSSSSNAGIQSMLVP